MAAHVVTVSLCLSSQPEGATPEEEAVHLSEEGVPESGSGSRVVGINPGVNGRGSVRPLHPREQNYDQGMTPFTVKHTSLLSCCGVIFEIGLPPLWDCGYCSSVVAKTTFII